MSSKPNDRLKKAENASKHPMILAFADIKIPDKDIEHHSCRSYMFRCPPWTIEK